MLVVLAFGGNALLHQGQPMTEQQRRLPPETVAYSADGLDEVGVCGVFFEFLAQPAYVYVDCSCVTNVVVAPYVLEQLVACQDSATVAHEVGQQVKLFGL